MSIVICVFLYLCQTERSKVNSYIFSDDCVIRFARYKDKSEGYHAGCTHVGTFSSPSLSAHQCAEQACAINGNVFNWDVDGECHVKQCTSYNQLELTTGVGYHIYVQYPES